MLGAGRRASAPDFAASDGEDLAVPQVGRRRLGRPLGLGQAAFDGRLFPGLAVVGAGQGAPGVVGDLCVAITTSEPQAHQPDLRNGEDVGDLDRSRGELRGSDQLEGHAVRRAIKVLEPFLADPADPEEGGAVGVQAFADGDFAEAGGVRHDRLRRPGAAKVRRGAGVGHAGVLSDRVSRTAAVDAD